jgi:proteasome lid subunit RPN8/RPN11
MIIFTPTAYQKIKMYTQGTDGEISGLGRSKITADKDILVKDIVILDQRNTSAFTDLDEAAMAEFLEKQIREGKDPSEWNIWWHSHSDFSVFWSSTDVDTIENATGGRYLISIVINKRMEALGRIDIFQPISLSVPIPIVRSKGRPKSPKEYLEKLCNRQINKCVETEMPGFYVNNQFLIPETNKRQSRSSEPETSGVWRRLGWQNWG